MNFKHIAIAATLAVSSLSSFAGDISFTDVAGSTGVDMSAAQTVVEGFVNDLTTTPVENTAIIFQDQVAAASVAVIEQAGATTSLAYIYQGAAAGDNSASVAYILQSATTAAVAVINQR
ncbi:MAG: hypothetical protein ACOYLV_05020 [Rubrivivax sp.]